MARRPVLLLLALLVIAPIAGAQDQALDPLLFAPKPSASEQVTDVEAQTLQLYRLPLALNLREMTDERWGIRITFPLSLTSLRVRRASDIGPFTRHLGIASVVPGVEFEIPIRPDLRLRPFAEAGFGKDTDEGRTEVLFGAGSGVMLTRPLGPLHLTYGGLAMYRRSNTSNDDYNGHANLEAGVDSQFPLRFSVGRKAARGGVYVIGRKFVGLSLERENQPPIRLGHQFETGVSFATAPDLQVWKIKLPWIAVGYQFGHTLAGVRFYMRFPF